MGQNEKLAVLDLVRPLTGESGEPVSRIAFRAPCSSDFAAGLPVHFTRYRESREHGMPVLFVERDTDALARWVVRLSGISEDQMLAMDLRDAFQAFCVIENLVARHKAPKLVTT